MYCARFGSTYTKIGTIQRRLAWPLRKYDMQIREVFHIFKPLQYCKVISLQLIKINEKKKKQRMYYLTVAVGQGSEHIY